MYRFVIEHKKTMQRVTVFIGCLDEVEAMLEFGALRQSPCRVSGFCETTVKSAAKGTNSRTNAQQDVVNEFIGEYVLWNHGLVVN